jgi:subtilase family serine protease
VRRFLVLLLTMVFSLPLFGFGPPMPMPVDPNKEGFAHPPIHVKDGATATYRNGFQPTQIKHGYGIDQLAQDGAGQTVAIVEAYGSPTILKDLDTFSTQFGLPKTTLNIVAPPGKSKTNAGWALETALDVEWVHAIAPQAKIMLVVAKSSSLSDLIGAVDYAVGHGAQVVSMSWGAGEFSNEASYDSHFNKAGMVFTASSGDNGSDVSWPAVSPYVVGVGGTTLSLKQDNTVNTETAWSGSGGGISGVLSEPAYQTGFQSKGMRGVPDVAFDADPATGVAVYDTTRYNGQSGWFVVGGTSLGAPSWAALFALVNQGQSSALTDGHAAVYGAAGPRYYASTYRDITSGSNGYSASTGYDFVTGVGSPIANNLVPLLRK